MNNIDLKRIILSILGLSIVAIIFSSIPFIAYYFTFKEYEVSTIPSDWAEFGGFIGGTSGVILSFFAVMFTLTSIYFTIIIAKTIQDNEFKFNMEQSISQLKITHAQSKPYPYIDLTRLTTRTSIIIQNMGLGPLIVRRVKINYNQGDSFENIRQLFDQKLPLHFNDGAQIKYNTAPDPILAPNSSILILEIIPNRLKNGDFKKAQSSCRNILKDCMITLEYEDIFKNEFVYSKELSFLGEPVIPATGKEYCDLT